MTNVLIWAYRPRIAFGMTLALAVVVAIATLTPAESLPSAPGGDKLHHFLAFGAVAFPAAFAMPRAAVWIVVAVACYGAIIEVIQPHVGRHGDIIDALANTVGAICGVTLGVALHRILMPKVMTP